MITEFKRADRAYIDMHEYRRIHIIDMYTELRPHIYVYTEHRTHYYIYCHAIYIKDVSCVLYTHKYGS